MSDTRKQEPKYPKISVKLEWIEFSPQQRFALPGELYRLSSYPPTDLKS